MNRSRLVLLLTGLALAICVVALASSPKALATVPQAKLMFDPSPASAGVVRTGFTSTTSVEVFNASGTVSAHISGVTINPPFSKAPNGDQCTGQTLGPAQSCNVTVQFAPLKKGKFSQALKVTVTGNKTVFKVTTTGTGSLTAATPTPSPSPTPSPTPTLAPTPAPTPAVAPTSAGDIFLLGGYASVPVLYDPVQQTTDDSGSFDSFTGGADGDVLPENYRSVSLPTGQILIAGGDNGTDAFANAYIYDPASQTVTPTASMNQARTQFTLTVLNNGQVLAVGGSPTWVNTSKLSEVAGSPTLQSAEIYDPIAKTWTIVASLTAARLAHAATLMPDGTVLVTGGLSYNAGSSAYTLAQDTEDYNPSSKSWASTSITLTSVLRFNHAAVLLDNGGVLLVGGQDGTSAVSKSPVYYSGPGQWTVVTPENTPRYSDAVTKLANGDILIAGGIDGSGNQLNTGEVFQFSGLTWTTIQNTLPDAASGQTATLMADGRAVIAGGTSPTVATFDRSTNLFAAGGSLPSAFAGAGSTALVVQPALNVLPVGVGPGIAATIVPGYQNVPYVSVKVCVPGTGQCRLVDGVVLDTGSTGLRLFASKLQGAGFSPLTSSGANLEECAGFVSGVSWGPLVQADIYMGGDIAKGENFQIIDDLNAFSPVPKSCAGNTTVFSSPSAPNVGFNGILGIGALSSDLDAATFYSCLSGGGTCTKLTSISEVAPNPVTGIHASFSANGSSTDYNGIGLTMNSVSGASQTAVYGNMTFGIGPGSNNIPSANVKVFPLTGSDTLITSFGSPVATNYLNSFIDSGSNGIFFNPPSNVSIPTCSIPGGPWYCPALPLSETATIKGATGTTSASVPFTIADEDSVLQSGGVYALSELAGPFGSAGIFDWGLPFFFNRTVYVGISGLPSLELGTGPYVAF